MFLMVMKHYSEEFRADAIALYLSDPARTYVSVARDLGMNAETLRVWVKAARAAGAGAGARQGGKAPISRRDVASGDVLEEENKKLRARVRELELERDILRKAAKFFAGETNW